MQKKGDTQIPQASLVDSLRLFMTNKGVKQSDIIEKTGISKPTLNRFLNKKTDLRSSDLNKILKYLGIDLKNIINNRLEDDVRSDKAPRIILKNRVYKDVGRLLESFSPIEKSTFLEQLVNYSKMRSQGHRSVERIESFIHNLRG